MSVENLFKTSSSSNVKQVNTISEGLQSVVKELQSLSEGKLLYFESALKQDNPEYNDTVFQQMEMIQGFESEAIRNLHNAFLYMEKLSKI